MEEVLENFEKDAVVLVPLLLLGRLLAGTARALWPREVGFSGLGVLFHVREPCRRDTGRGLQLCFKRNQDCLEIFSCTELSLTITLLFWGTQLFPCCISNIQKRELR